MEQNISASKAGLKYGIYGGVALLLYSLITYVTGIVEPTDPDPSPLLKYLPLIITLVVMVLAIKFFKDSNEGYLNIGEGIVTAIVTGIIMTLFSLLWSVTYFYIIDPEGMETLRANIIEMSIEQGKMTEEQAEQAGGFINMFTSVPAFAILGLISSIIIGLIVGLITSLIMKNTRD